MDFGVTVLPDPPFSRWLELMKAAEAHGFQYAWTYDSHVLWQESIPMLAVAARETAKIKLGHFVTNPATRDPTVLASAYATLHDLSDGRMAMGIGRGDSAVRMLNGSPVTLATLRESIEVIRALANGEQASYNGNLLQFPWSVGSELPMWVAAYGPKALALTGEVADGFILQLADPTITEWAIAAVRKAAADAGRDPSSVTICAAAPAYVTDGTPANLEHARNQCRWFGGMVGNHVADIVNRYGADKSGVPKPLVDYISGRTGYDYNQHGKAGNTHTDFVPDDVIDRFCLIGPVETHVARLRELESLGVDQFALYLQHDAKSETLAAYGDRVLPAVNIRKAAKA